MKYSILVILSILFMSFQCEKDENDPLADQDILFARIFENHAWGDIFEGWFIDNAGYVRGFSLYRNPDLQWINFSEAGFNSTEEVFQNIMQADTTLTTLPIVDLYKYYQLIPEASKGVLSEADPQGADMGQYSYYALHFFPEENKYRWVLLKSAGDFTISNTSKEASKILSFLQDVDSSLGYNGYIN